MELQNFIQRLKELQKHAGSGAQIVQVLVESHGSLGGRKSVPIKDIQLGFDWESGRVLLTAEQVLTNISSDDVAAIVASKNKAQSWHSYQQHKQYAADKKMLQERVTELEAKLVRTQIAAYTLCDAVEGMNDLDELYEATTEARDLLRNDAGSGEAVDAEIALFEPVEQSNIDRCEQIADSALAEHRQPTIGSGLQFLSAKDGKHWPTIGDKYLVRINGVLQNEVFEFDQGDSDFVGGDLYWDHNRDTECPLFNSESDEWLPLASLAAQRQQGGDV